MNWLRNFIGALLKAIAEWVDRCIPKFQPNLWNADPFVQGHNNCYNYGCDKRTDTYAQPGRKHGITLLQATLSCANVTSAAVADGLASVNCDEGCGCSQCWHQVALVISPGFDYHWYRKDRDGNWSHKMGPTPATNLDNSGNIITDPRTADRGSYTIFCGCFCVNKMAIDIT